MQQNGGSNSTPLLRTLGYINKAKYVKIMNSPDILCTLLELVRTHQSATAAACTIQAAK